MLTTSTDRIIIQKVSGDINNFTEDVLAVEEPLEISVSQPGSTSTLSITMRTPGSDDFLAAGFLFTEGIIRHAEEIKEIHSLGLNKITVTLYLDTDLKKLQRNFYTTSSCGVCGKSSLEAISTIRAKHKTHSTIPIDISVMFSLHDKLKNEQSLFQSTGGLHASALFQHDGAFITLKEDVGRHNALDKLIGEQLLNGKVPLNNHILLLSGRASFELIQKAVMAGITFVVAIGAPSSLAVELAKDHQVTLIGFLKNHSFNIYNKPDTLI
jgi:FdhD protein